MKKRLSIRKINAWLDEHGGNDRILNPKDLIDDEDSYIKFIYALLYGDARKGDSRKNFTYSIEENEEDSGMPNSGPASVKAADYIVPGIRFRKV